MPKETYVTPEVKSEILEPEALCNTGSPGGGYQGGGFWGSWNRWSWWWK